MYFFYALCIISISILLCSICIRSIIYKKVYVLLINYSFYFEDIMNLNFSGRQTLIFQ